MPITPQEAYDHTNPGDPPEQRQANAEAICAGVAANDAYIQSRDPIEQLALLAKGGQSVPVKAPDTPPADVQSTAVEVPAKESTTQIAEQVGETALGVVEDVVPSSKPVISGAEGIVKAAEEILTPFEKQQLEKLLGRIGL